MLPPLRAVILGLDGAVTDQVTTPGPAGVRELAEDLVASGIRVGVTSCGSRAWAAPLVDRLIGRGTSDVLATGDDVAGIDPHPEVHLVALYRLGVRAGEALAVESSLPGARSARAAGMAAVLVSDSAPRRAGAADNEACGVFEHTDGPYPLTVACCRAAHCAWWLRERMAGGAA